MTSVNRNKNPYRFIIGHININLIRNKFESHVKYVGNNVDILLVSEAKIDDTSPESQFLIDGFQHLIDLIGQLRVDEFCPTEGRIYLLNISKKSQ